MKGTCTCKHEFPGYPCIYIDIFALETYDCQPGYLYVVPGIDKKHSTLGLKRNNKVILFTQNKRNVTANNMRHLGDLKHGGRATPNLFLKVTGDLGREPRLKDHMTSL